jgi:hypothetical protein
MERQAFDKGRIEVVTVGGMTVGRLILQPGWKWSESVKPIVKTDCCELHHVGYVVSGKLKVVMNDGMELELVAGDAYEISPGHDAWVIGKHPYVALEMASAARYAKPSE